MKVILYMAIAANGLIAKEDDNTDFTSKEDWAGFKQACLNSKAVIAGRRTYESLRNYDDYFFRECTYFVPTTTLASKNETRVEKNSIFVNLLPTEILKLIEQKGFNVVCIVGGAYTNASFIKEGLVDEIYLDIEPFLFGKGIPLFRPADFEINLELLEVKNLSPQTVQLHYKIKK